MTKKKKHSQLRSDFREKPRAEPIVIKPKPGSAFPFLGDKIPSTNLAPMTAAQKLERDAKDAREGKIVFGIIVVVIIVCLSLPWIICKPDKTPGEQWFFSADVVSKTDNGTVVDIAIQNIHNFNDDRIWYEGRGLSLSKNIADMFQIGRRYSIWFVINTPDEIVWAKEIDK